MWKYPASLVIKLLLKISCCTSYFYPYISVMCFIRGSKSTVQKEENYKFGAVDICRILTLNYEKIKHSRKLDHITRVCMIKSKSCLLELGVRF